ncbi:MAG: hypothetical protein AB7O24_25050 [Kofleriaceae bacterium]
MRYWWVALALIGCGHDEAARPATPPTPAVKRDAAIAAPDAEPELPAHQRYRDLEAALAAIIPSDARVIGFGELHSRVDRANVRSSLSWFTAALPGFAAKLSDLVIETWLVDPNCGQEAVAATKRVEAAVKRPEATKSEIALLADAAKAAKVQPHAMRLSCGDYKQISPMGKEPDPIAMLTITTRELARIAASAVAHRDKDPAHRPWIAVYGGALHNDRFPEQSVAEWSYAAVADKASGGKFVEIDLIVPELAAADDTSTRQPWFPIAEAPHDDVAVWTRGERSFVVVLPTARR